MEGVNMSGTDNCNVGNLDWSEVDIMSVIDAAKIGDKRAEAELRRREKSAGITRIDTVTPKFSVEEIED